MSNPVLKFDGSVSGGKFIPDQPEAFLNHVKKLEGERVVATLKKYRKYDQRSNDQNRYYWGVVIKMLSDELGYTPDEMHEAIKYQFLAEPKEVKRKDGERKIMIIPGSTSSLSTGDFEGLMSKIRSWASFDFGIYIPEPNAVPWEY